MYSTARDFVPTWMWNNSEETLRARNCYAYFLQDLRNTDGDDLHTFPHPGALAALVKRNRRLLPTEPYRCDALNRAILADNPNIFKSTYAGRCPSGFYKGFAAVDTSVQDGDFHFWVEHDNGRWSHKPGRMPVTFLDQAGKPIDNPLLAARGRYNEPCGFFCVPHNTHAETRSASRSAADSAF